MSVCSVTIWQFPFSGSKGSKKPILNEIVVRIFQLCKDNEVALNIE